MELSDIISLLQQSLFVIVVFLGFLIFAMIKGRQSLINLIMGLYLALLFSLEFPYYAMLTKTGSSHSIVMILVFVVFTILSALLFKRLMPREWDETAFEGFNKKLLYAIAATILVLVFSYHALPVTDFVDPGPIQSLFAPKEWFFGWLLVPLVILFLLG